MGGWIEWQGGECPVDGYTVVDVKLRGRIHADKTLSDEARCFRWTHTRGPNPECVDGFCQGNADIIAYRVIHP